MNNEYYLCIDLGGTKLVCLSLNARGVIVRDVTITATTRSICGKSDTFSCYARPLILCLLTLKKIFRWRSGHRRTGHYRF